MQIPIYELDGYEADDVIGTLARQATTGKSVAEVIVVTGDRDLLQLVNSKIKLFMPVKGLSEAKLFGEKEAEERLGVPPTQVVDLKALMGDPSDNYPGVVGIGPKTAITLLKAFGSLERIYKNLTKIKNPIKVKGDDSKENLGLIHVITGDGKGKTTSSLGLALRAVGNNLRVYMIQFLKSGFTGELYSAKKLGFTIEQFGVDALKEKQKHLQEFADRTSSFVFQPDVKEKDAAMQGWEHAKNMIKSGNYDLIILDEINCVLAKDLIPIKEVMDIVKEHGKVELVLTGRDAPEELMGAADYVNVVQRVKHPWQKGVVARKGIEY
jgi:cob(I)alamin adenosyltransferase